MNKRGDFRLMMLGHPIVVRNEHYKTGGKIENISGTGMAVELKSDFFLQEVTVNFELNEKPFERKAVIINKKSHSSGAITYRLQFVEYTEKEREWLHSEIVALAAIRLTAEE